MCQPQVPQLPSSREWGVPSTAGAPPPCCPCHQGSGYIVFASSCASRVKLDACPSSAPRLPSPRPLALPSRTVRGEWRFTLPWLPLVTLDNGPRDSPWADPGDPSQRVFSVLSPQLRGQVVSIATPCVSLSFSVFPLQPRRIEPAGAVHGPRGAQRPCARPRRHLPQVREAPMPKHQPRRRLPAPPPPARASLKPYQKRLRVCPSPTSIKEFFILSALCSHWSDSDLSLF